MRWRSRLFAVLASAAVIAAVASTALAIDPQQPFFNGFETDTAGWFDNSGQGFGVITREPSGFVSVTGYAGGVASATGGFHARVRSAGCNIVGPGSCPGPFTGWGATVPVPGSFPGGGYTTEVAVYLDVVSAASHLDTRFDWDSTVHLAGSPNYLRYVFNAETTSAGFLIGSSQQSGRIDADPSNACPNPSTPPNACRAPVTIASSGWYRFRHTFRDDGTGKLAVDMTILNSSGGVVPGASWTIFQSLALSALGGPNFGWFENEEIPELAIDDSRMDPVLPFRDVRRANDITFGPNVCGTAYQAMNLKGSTTGAGDTWITVYDTTPGDASAKNTFGNTSTSADVLIKNFNNKKGAGLLALFNEGPGQKGVALVILDSGNTDTLAIGTVSSANGTFTVLQTASLGNQISECAWYHLTMNVSVSGGTAMVTGTVLRHDKPSDPTSAIGGQVGSDVTALVGVSGAILATGEVGIVGLATGAVEDSSVTNFQVNGTPGGGGGT